MDRALVYVAVERVIQSNRYFFLDLENSQENIFSLTRKVLNNQEKVFYKSLGKLLNDTSVLLTQNLITKYLCK